VDDYQIIAARFQQTIENIALSVDQLADPISQGSELMSQVLLQGGRLFCCGYGPDAAASQLFVSTMIGRLDQERPALPAISLAADSTGLTAVLSEEDASETFSRPLRALGRENDLLLALHSGGQCAALAAAVDAAHESGMLVVAVTCAASGELTAALRAGDANIAITAQTRPQRIELQTMVVNSLCQLIEHSLFGSYPEE
jgi:D-sedoheptulose 7-phosphate isomerase